MSLTGLAAGPIIGFSANPRTILKFKNELALAHPHYVCEQVKKAIEVIIITKKWALVDCLLLLVLAVYLWSNLKRRVE